MRVGSKSIEDRVNMEWTKHAAWTAVDSGQWTVDRVEEHPEAQESPTAASVSNFTVRESERAERRLLPFFRLLPHSITSPPCSTLAPPSSSLAHPAVRLFPSDAMAIETASAALASVPAAVPGSIDELSVVLRQQCSRVREWYGVQLHTGEEWQPVGPHSFSHCCARVCAPTRPAQRRGVVDSAQSDDSASRRARGDDGTLPAAAAAAQSVNATRIR